VNSEVKAAFPGHAATTVSEIGWRGSKDSTLLTYAQDSFDVSLQSTANSSINTTSESCASGPS